MGWNHVLCPLVRVRHVVERPQKVFPYFHVKFKVRVIKSCLVAGKDFNKMFLNQSGYLNGSFNLLMIMR